MAGRHPPARRHFAPSARTEARGGARMRRSGDLNMAMLTQTPAGTADDQAGREDGTPDRSLGADIIIANAPDPVFVSDLEGKILQANDAVSELLGFRPDELIEQSLSKF